MTVADRKRSGRAKSPGDMSGNNEALIQSRLNTYHDDMTEKGINSIASRYASFGDGI